VPTDVKFYHLVRDPLELVLPMLASRAYAQGLRLVIRAPDEACLARLDSLLWSYDAESFLPHGTPRTGHADVQPIYLSTGVEVPNGARLLMLVEGRLDDDVSTFEKCFYLFDGRDDAAVATARRAWSLLKGQGLDMGYWQQTDAGRWEQKA
jgi:DNA polymerase III subunit chi